MAEDRTGVVARLDALEAAHKAATPGPWEQDGEYPTEVYNGRVGNSEELIADCHTRADAAAIVAEHNLTPALIAAVRGVLDLADGWDDFAATRLTGMDARHMRAAASDVRSRVAAAIEGAGQ